MRAQCIQLDVVGREALTLRPMHTTVLRGPDTTSVMHLSLMRLELTIGA